MFPLRSTAIPLGTLSTPMSSEAFFAGPPLPLKFSTPLPATTRILPAVSTTIFDLPREQRCKCCQQSRLPPLLALECLPKGPGRRRDLLRHRYGWCCCE